MTVKAEAYLAIEQALTKRLASSWTTLAGSIFKKVDDAVQKGAYHEAHQIADSADVSPIFDDNSAYIRYSIYSAMLFGASRLTGNLKATAVARGIQDENVRKLTKVFRASLDVNFADHIRDRLHDYIDDAERQDVTLGGNADSTGQIHKYDPDQPRDEAGRFTFAVEGPTADGRFQVIDTSDRSVHGTHGTKELADKRVARLNAMRRKKYDPDQPRDEQGQWTSTDAFGNEITLTPAQQARIAELEAKQKGSGQDPEKYSPTATPEYHAAAKAAITSVLEHGKATGNEAAVIVGADGKVLLDAKGEAHSVGVPEGEYQGGDLIHNHPSGSPLSKADIRLGHHMLMTIHAVDEDGGRFSMVANTMVGEGTMKDFIGAVDATIHSHIIKNFKDLQKTVAEAGKVVRGAPDDHSPEERAMANMHAHLLSEKLDEMGVIKYRHAMSDRFKEGLKLSGYDKFKAELSPKIDEAVRRELDWMFADAGTDSQKHLEEYLTDLKTPAQQDWAGSKLKADGGTQYIIDLPPVYSVESYKRALALADGLNGAEKAAYLAALKPYAKVIKAEEVRVARPYVDFNKSGDRFLQMISTLHTSRASGFGFTAEADVLNVERYALSEQLDIHICPVCAVMHGKVFEVQKARRSYEQILDTVDPEALRSLQPWPGQSVAAVEELKSLTNEELVKRNWHIPPFHPLCRGMLVHTGSVPKLPGLPTATETGADPMTPEGFDEFGINFDQAQVEKWNRNIPANVGDVLAGFTGMLPKAIMDGGGVDSLNVTLRVMDQGLLLKGDAPMFGSTQPVNSRMKLNMTDKEAELVTLSVGEEDQGKGVGKAALASYRDLWKRVGITKVALDASDMMGAYAWARYGFVPAPYSWDFLRDELVGELAAIEGKLTKATYNAARTALNSTDPKMLWALSDLSETVDGVPLGKHLLAGRFWSGALDLADADSVTRFDQYIGG